jgi:hypothetical protein
MRVCVREKKRTAAWTAAVDCLLCAACFAGWRAVDFNFFDYEHGFLDGYFGGFGFSICAGSCGFWGRCTAFTGGDVGADGGGVCDHVLFGDSSAE